MEAILVYQPSACPLQYCTKLLYTHITTWFLDWTLVAATYFPVRDWRGSTEMQWKQWSSRGEIFKEFTWRPNAWCLSTQLLHGTVTMALRILIAETWKSSNQSALDRLTDFLLEVWQADRLPPDHPTNFALNATQHIWVTCSKVRGRGEEKLTLTK